jgi:hypothetical protein
MLGRLSGLRDVKGNPILDLSGFVQVWNESFAYDFVDPAKLTKRERAVWDMLPTLLELASDHTKRVKDVRISNTMRLDEGAYETEGVWDSPSIVLKRSVLDSPKHFASVLLHEIAHASSGANHGNLAFMAAIDDLAGLAAVEATTSRRPAAPAGAAPRA